MRDANRTANLNTLHVSHIEMTLCFEADAAGGIQQQRCMMSEERDRFGTNVLHCSYMACH